MKLIKILREIKSKPDLLNVEKVWDLYLKGLESGLLIDKYPIQRVLMKYGWDSIEPTYKFLNRLDYITLNKVYSGIKEIIDGR